MKILLDTDVLLDIALKRDPFFEHSAQVLDWAENNPQKASVAWHSLSNLNYLIRPDARGFIRDLLEFALVPSVGTEEAKTALSMPMKDFEDALQASAALTFKASWIVTRNLAHFKRSPVPALSPTEFLSRFVK